MIGQHPQLYGVPELNLFVADRLEQIWEQMVGMRQIQLHGLLRTVAHLYAGEQTLSAVDMARRWIFLRLKSSTAEIYWALCNRTAPLRIIDKSPIYVDKPANLQRMDAAFPQAHYIHLLRHPLTQGESIMRIADGAMALLTNSIDYSTDPPTIDPQIAWYRVQKNILDFLKTVPVDRQLCLHGEDVLTDPENHLRQICRWLGISDSDDSYQAMLHPEESPFARLGPLGAHLGNDINFLRSPFFKPGKIRPSSLESPLPWRKDNKGFSPEVIALAREMNYR